MIRSGRGRGRGRSNRQGRSEDYIGDCWSVAEYGTGKDPEDDADVADKEKAGVLKVKGVDLDIKANTIAHHTDQYDIADCNAYNDIEMLVVRRGQQFHIKIEFNRPYDETKDDLRLIFEFGNTPSSSKGSRVDFILSEKDLPNEWRLVTKKDGACLTIAITTPPTCAVAKWTMRIDVVKQKKNKKSRVFRYTHKDPIYILFNPWCKDDQVYQEQDKDEYILNETGKIYRGSSKRFSGCPWNFGQFSECVLPCAMELLDNISSIKDSFRGDAVKVARSLSSLVNGFDNQGVLAGNWSGDYTGGKSPLDWNGSVEILAEYYSTKKTVNYGQCWVFSGVLTTICRALGIPTRSVTNFESAHDTDDSCTIDTVYTRDWETISADSVWNFHVWNEVWMRREDLPEDFKGPGWQIIDATPQERSDGVFCMGPVPTAAIKLGFVYLPFDGRFAFAEVNADRVYWYTDYRGKTKVLYIKKSCVGMKISTKTPLSDERLDITDQYKFQEGTAEERAAVQRANLYTRKLVYDNKDGDVTFSFLFDDDTFIGDTIKLDLKITNTAKSKRTVNGYVKIASARYTGDILNELGKQAIKNTVLKAMEEKRLSLEVPVNEYLHKVDPDHLNLKMMCGCEVDETEQIFKDEDDRRLRKPHLTIKAPTGGTVGKTFKTAVSFVNPLSVPLTNCRLKVDGPGLQETANFKQKNVKAKGTFTTDFKLTPVKPGMKEIIVSFNSAELTAVNGSDLVLISK